MAIRATQIEGLKMAGSHMALFDEPLVERMTRLFHRAAVNRCLALLRDADIGAERAPLPVGRAKDRFSNVLGKARAGEAQVVGLESAPVVILSAESLLRLMCTASSAITVAEALTGVSGAPTPAHPLHIVNRGGKRQALPVPAAAEPAGPVNASRG